MCASNVLFPWEQTGFLAEHLICKNVQPWLRVSFASTSQPSLNLVPYNIYYCGQESLRRNGVAIKVNKRVRNAVLGCNLKNDRMISVHFQGKPFNITVIQVYAPTSNAEEAEVKWFYEDLQDLLELIPKKDVLFIIGDWNVKSRKSRNTWSNRQSWPWSAE